MNSSNFNGLSDVQVQNTSLGDELEVITLIDGIDLRANIAVSKLYSLCWMLHNALYFTSVDDADFHPSAIGLQPTAYDAAKKNWPVR